MPGFTQNAQCSANKEVALASVVILKLPPKHNVSLRKGQTHQPWASVHRGNNTSSCNKHTTPSGLMQLRLISY